MPRPLAATMSDNPGQSLGTSQSGWKHLIMKKKGGGLTVIIIGTGLLNS